MGFFSRLLCQHEWVPHGTGYDDYVKCVKCGRVKDREPGDISHL